MRTSMSSTIRVPTPEEVTSWIFSLGPRLRAYVREPEHQVMWGVILLGAALRFSHLDLIPLRAEQVEHLQTALVLMGREQPLNVPSLSTTSDVLPMFHYLLSIPLLMGRDPRLISAFIVLLNMAAIGGFYRLVRRHYGVRVSFLATVFFSSAPWAVIFARRISCEGLLIPLAVLLFQGCVMALLDAEPLGWSLAAITLGVMLYTTLLSLPLIFAFIVLIAMYHRRVQWSYLLFGICLALLIFTPYLYEQNLSRFADFRSLLQRLSIRTSVPPAQPALRAATSIHSGQQLSELVAPSQKAFQLTSPLFLRIAQLEGVLFLLTLPGTVFLALHAWGHWKRGEDHAKYVLPAVFLWGSLLATGLQPHPVESRHLTMLYPWGFLAMGLLIDSATSVCTPQHLGSLGWSFALRLGTYTLFLLLILWNAYAVIYLYDFLPRHDTEEAFGIPYRFWKQTAQLIQREATAVGGDQIWIITQRDNPRQVPIAEALPYLTKSRLEMVTLSQQDQPSAPLPAERPGIYLFTDPAPLVEDTVEELGGQKCGAILFPSEQSLWLEIVEEKTVQELLSTIQERGDWTFDAGLQLIGYNWDGKDALLSTYWTFSAPPPLAQRREHLLQTCLQKEGEKVACCSGFGLNERYWEEGLVLKQWYTFSLSGNRPPEEYELWMEIQQSRTASGMTEARYIQPYQAYLGTVFPTE